MRFLKTLRRNEKRYLDRYLFTYKRYITCKDEDQEEILLAKLSEMEYVLENVLGISYEYFNKLTDKIFDELNDPERFRGFM